MSLSEITATFRWWAVLMFLGLAALPLTYRLFSRLPDKGYAFSKMIGLLLVGYFFWLFGALGFVRNTVGGIIVALLIVVSLSGWSLWQTRNTGGGKEQETVQLSFFDWLRRGWRYILTTELLFALVFALWIWVRAQNPAISATEKPMEFAFLNSASRSPTYPPLDPWLSGFAISYYYFGYIMTSIVGRLAVVPEQVGFNLAIAWLMAGAALGAFGFVYNLIRASSEAFQRRAIIFGLVAAVAIPIAGNMEITLEVMHANGLGSDDFWSWLDVRDLNSPATLTETPRYETTSWWWWRSSRVIHEYHLSGRPEEGLEPIAEFPAFSFVLGDLHPHVLALPFAFLSLTTALAWWLWDNAPKPDLTKWRQGFGLRSHASTLTVSDILFVLFTVLVLGGLSFLNTWDVLIHLFIVLGAYVLAQWRLAGRWHKQFLGQVLVIALVLVLLASLFYLPFYLGFKSQAGPPFLLPMIMRPTRLAHYLIIFAMPLIAVVTLLATLIIKTAKSRRAFSTRHPALVAMSLAIGLVLSLSLLLLLLAWVVASSPLGAGQAVSLANELGLSLSAPMESSSIVDNAIWGANAVFLIAPALLRERLAYPALTIFLTGLVSSVIFLLILLLDRGEERDPGVVAEWLNGSLPFVLLIIVTAALLSLGPEFVYLKDNFGQRLNTIFKFYYQAWILFGTAAIFGLHYLLRFFRLTGIIVAVTFGLALVSSLLFPWFAVQSRATEYSGPNTMADKQPATLDGTAYLKNLDPGDYEAITWLRENVDGAPVILEAIGGQYSGYGRVAAGTGLPTVLGWAGHEYQWRGVTPEPAEREPLVSAIYSASSWDNTQEILNLYGIEYIYFGRLERSTYDPRSAEKFDLYLDVAYQNSDVTIYRWNPYANGRE